jgi:hypothetical protein
MCYATHKVFKPRVTLNAVVAREPRNTQIADVVEARLARTGLLLLAAEQVNYYDANDLNKIEIAGSTSVLSLGTLITDTSIYTFTAAPLAPLVTPATAAFIVGVCHYICVDEKI